MQCVDLKQHFGDRFRIEYEESYHAERPEFRAQEAAWLTLIPCQHGHIIPWGGDLLAACTDKRGPLAKKLVESSVTEPWMGGDDGVNVKFDIRHFDEVAEIMKPRRRHRHGFKLSSEHRQKLVEAGEKHRFQPNDTGTERSPGDRRRARSTEPDTLVT